MSVVRESTSKNSLVAKSGNQAEDILCRSTNILKRLGVYFNKKIVKCEKVPKRKKSDIVFTFEDGTMTYAQLKNGNGGGRGWSFDRRSVENLPTSDSLKQLLKIVCLKSSGERSTVINDRELITRLLTGDDDSTKPDHFIHTTTKDGVIQSLSVCTASVFIDHLLKNAFDNCVAKRTCVHLTPRIYLQRKGGGKADHSPDDIQAKLSSIPDCMIPLSLCETTISQQEQIQ